MGSGTPAGISADPVIDVRDVSKAFGDTIAVDGVSFEVCRGEVLGFLGPNAAGKTTTMRILTGYLAPDAGTAMVAGRDIHTHSLEVRRRLGYLPESAPLYLDMGVLDHLRFVAELRGIAPSSIDARIADMIGVCGLAGVVHKNVGELSKGYRQRVGLAITMIHNPDVLILDEPTTGLDPSQIIEIRELIREIGRERTVILSTHILPEVEATSSRVLIINEGRIVASGTPDELASMAVGTERVVVAARAPREELGRSVTALPGVIEATELGEDADGYVRYALIVQKGAPVVDGLFDAVTGRGWRLRELTTERVSLEDVFLRLTAGGGPDADPTSDVGRRAKQRRWEDDR